MRREREGEQEPKCCGEVEPEHRTGQCRKHCLGYCRGHRRALHGVLQGASHKVRQGASQGAFPRSSLLYQWGEARGCLPQSPPDQGFPICPTAPGWGFSANLPVGCRAAPGSGDVPRSGENGVQGLELTPHVACLNPRLPPRPPKTLPRERLQNWESKVGATSSISPHPADPCPVLSQVSPRGQGWGQGYFGPERWFSGRKRMGNPELPPCFPRRRPSLSPEQPLSFLPARQFNVQPSCKRSPGLQFPALGDLPKDLLPFPWETNEEADPGTEGTRIYCSPHSAAGPPSRLQPCGFPTVLGMLNTRNPRGRGPRSQDPAVPPPQQQPMPRPGRYWVVASPAPRPQTSHRCKHHTGVIQMSHPRHDCIKPLHFLITDVTIASKHPGKPPPPRGTTLQPAVRCKAPSLCHGAEPSAHGHVPRPPAGPKGVFGVGWTPEAGEMGRGGRWSNGRQRDGEKLEIARAAPGDRSGPTEGRELGRRMSRARP